MATLLTSCIIGTGFCVFLLLPSAEPQMVLPNVCDGLKWLGNYQDSHIICTGEDHSHTVLLWKAVGKQDSRLWSAENPTSQVSFQPKAMLEKWELNFCSQLQQTEYIVEKICTIGLDQMKNHWTFDPNASRTSWRFTVSVFHFSSAAGSLSWLEEGMLICLRGAMPTIAPALLRARGIDGLAFVCLSS